MRVVSEQPHDFVEESLVALEPEHRCVVELLVHRVEVEEDRRALRQDLRDESLEIAPSRINQELAGTDSSCGPG